MTIPQITSAAPPILIPLHSGFEAAALRIAQAFPHHQTGKPHLTVETVAGLAIALLDGAVAAGATQALDIENWMARQLREPVSEPANAEGTSHLAPREG
ncbi:hypothetical protein [Roseococcus pinisoli]|uniref:Uncharacterized protein n=1 Tax=Roseococcus pinisoli TaxID=2835040 RepID=A0ABS5QD75_9PROT|nr:hypothetical protein [Roseococcus pinisoli]MBS7811226.1 hypothetical protein [Roseococcus pinisoli]